MEIVDSRINSSGVPAVDNSVDDAHTQSKASVIGADGFDADRDLRKIVDDMFCSSLNAVSPGK